MGKTKVSRFWVRGCCLVGAVMLASGLVVAGLLALSRAGSLVDPLVVTDMTPSEPLMRPLPCTYDPRYVSGFGTDDVFTVFFEDRSSGSPYPIA